MIGLSEIKKMDAFGDVSSTASNKTDLMKRDNKSYDKNFKKFFQRKEVLAGILLNVVPEFKGMKHEDVIKRIQGSSVNNMNAELLESEDVEVDQTVMYDVVAKVQLLSETADVHLIFDLEMQRKYNANTPLMNRAHYYVSRLIAKQRIEHAQYKTLSPVQSTWITFVNSDKMKTLENKHFHFEFVARDDKGELRPDIFLPGQNLARIDMLFLSRDYYWNTEDSEIVKFLQSIFHNKLCDKDFNPYVKESDKVNEEVRELMFENDQYLADVKEEIDEIFSTYINKKRAIGMSDDWIKEELISSFDLSPEDAKRYLEEAKE